jgi:predicted transposase/invertase (TIGR01784 family)
VTTINYKELEKMFSLGDIKQTKVYQEAKEEGREEGREKGFEEGELKAKKQAIPSLLALGLTVKQIAQALNLSEETVKKFAENQEN